MIKDKGLPMNKKEINKKGRSTKLNLHVRIHYSVKGVQLVEFENSQEDLKWSFHSKEKNISIEEVVNEWLNDYSQGKNSRVFVPLDWSSVTVFTRGVLEKVAEIPLGRVSSYGKIAELLHRPEAARAVGGACGRNPFLLFVPCHRVLDAKSELRGFSAGGIGVKRKLLLFEGGVVEKD